MLSATTSRAVRLSRRQRDVLRLIADGKTNPQIADTLGISLDGAKWHVGVVLDKLDVANREQAAEYWRSLDERNRIVAPGWLTWLGVGSGVAASLAGLAFTGAILLDRHRDHETHSELTALTVVTPTATPRSDLDSALALTIQCLADRGIAAEVVQPDGNQLPRLQLLPLQQHPETVDPDVRECRAMYLDGPMDDALRARAPDALVRFEARQFVAQCIANAGGSVTSLYPEDADISQWLDSPDPVTRIAAGSCIEERYKVYGF